MSSNKFWSSSVCNNCTLFISNLYKLVINGNIVRGWVLCRGMQASENSFNNDLVKSNKMKHLQKISFLSRKHTKSFSLLKFKSKIILIWYSIKARMWKLDRHNILSWSKKINRVTIYRAKYLGNRGKYFYRDKFTYSFESFTKYFLSLIA